MYIWFKARKITNQFLQFENITSFVPALTSLSTNTLEPKYATHLVYLTKANNKKSIETRILESILSKRPKRADVYWLIHIERADDPYTMEYAIEEIEHDRIIRVEFKLGFRIQPRVNLLFRRVLQDMLDHHELDAGCGQSGFNKHNITADIRYVMMQRFLSVENEFSMKEGFILKSYFWLSKLGLSDKKAFGLDLSDTKIEKIPLVVTPIHTIPLKRMATI